MLSSIDFFLEMLRRYRNRSEHETQAKLSISLDQMIEIFTKVQVSSIFSRSEGNSASEIWSNWSQKSKDIEHVGISGSNLNTGHTTLKNVEKMDH